MNIDLKWPLRSYNPYMLNTYDADEVYTEYRKQRKALQARLRKMRGTGFENSLEYKALRKVAYRRMTRMSEEQRKADLATIVKQGLMNPRTTPEGYEYNIDKTLEALHKRNYNFVTRENVEDFGNFMSEFKSVAESLGYDSAEVADAWGEYIDSGKDSENYVYKHFEKWLAKRLGKR